MTGTTIIAFVVGMLVGFFIAALMMAASDDDRRHE
jgi:uncharacterized protein YneF (UPF0154 family)